MARTRSVRTQGGGSGGAPVRISVTLSEDTWARLRSLALVRRTTATALVEALVVKAVEGVRLPSVRGDGTGDDAAA
jgi:predicted DNA-binding ribbon-helix-helix protein